MGRLALLWWSLWLCAGCASKPVPADPLNPHYRPVAGSRADVRSQPGPRDGYLIETCTESHCLGVRGQGEAQIPGLHETPETEDGRKNWQRFRAELRTTLQGIGSLHSSGFGGACKGGTVFWLWDWRQVDQAIEQVGTFLRGRNLKENVTLCVTPGGADENVRSPSNPEP
jgi:hypothetical protein